MTPTRALATAGAAWIIVTVASPAGAQTPSPEPVVTEAPVPDPPATPPTPPATEPEPETVYVGAPDVAEAETDAGPVTDSAATKAAPARRAPAANVIWWSVGYRRAGLFTTARLQSLIARLSARGMSESDLASYYAPFIVGGNARFWDSWGEVRLAVHGLRPHLGQDVFCDYGAPVLASEFGTIEFGSDATGGLVARLFRNDGSYWYYAHLSAFASGLTSGDRVSPGTVIGHCGTSGNATSTPPHVHFGLYVGHTAQNPVDSLVAWLSSAETHAEQALARLRRRPGSVRLLDASSKPPVDDALGAEPPGCGKPPENPLSVLTASLEGSLSLLARASAAAPCLWVR